MAAAKTAEKLIVGRTALVALFVALGFKAANTWNEERMAQKVEKLPSLLEEGQEVEDKEQNKLLKEILAAVEANTDIEIVNDAKGKKKAADDDDDDPKPKAAAKKKAADDDEDPAPVKKKVAAEDDGEEEPKPKKKVVAEEDGESEEKPKKKAPPAKAGGEGSPGVIGSIVEFLTNASEDKPVSKEGLVNKLAKRFPDRDPDSMKKTVNVQVPSRIKADKGLDVKSCDLEGGGKGYWIDVVPAGSPKDAKKKKAADDE